MPARASRPIVEFLKASSFLGRLSEDVLEQIVRKAQMKTYARRQVVFRQNERGDSALIILRGRLKVTSTTVDGREIGHNFLRKGDLVGEIALLDGGTRTATVTALEQTEALSITRRELLPLLLTHPEASLEIIEALCQKLRTSTAKAEDHNHGMTARLARGLLRLAEQHGVTVKDRIRIDMKMSQTELGDYVGIARTNVSRLQARLKADGIVDSDNGFTVIRDMKRLAELANAQDASG